MGSWGPKVLWSSVTKWTQLSIQHGQSAGSPEFSRSGLNHSRVIPFRYYWAKVTFALSRWNALAWSWKQSSHWTFLVLSFLGSVPSKVSSSWTLAQEEEELLVRQEEWERQLVVMARLWKTARPGSNSSVVSMKSLSSLSLSLSPSPGSSGSFPGPSSGPNHWNQPDSQCSRVESQW